MTNQQPPSIFRTHNLTRVFHNGDVEIRADAKLPTNLRRYLGAHE